MTNIVTTLSYSAGSTIKATAEAYNSKGWSIPSIPNTIGEVAKIVPNAPINLAVSVLSTTSVSLTWNEITTSPSDGYSTVTSYNVLSNGGSGSIFTVVSTSSAGSATLTGLTNGVIYTFKVSAVNLFGQSAASSSVSIKVATVPFQMNAPVIQYSLANVALAFSYPSSGGISITDFEIKLSSDGIIFTEYTDLCNGSDPIVQSGTLCTFTMSQLIAKGFVGGNSIQAKARAYNSLGWGPESLVSNVDILVQVIPNAPINLAVANVDASTLIVTWDALTTSQDLGYASLTEYKLYWDQGTGIEVLHTAGLTSTSLVIGSLTAGTTYAFKVSASNIQGEGSLSSVASAKVKAEPGQMDAVTMAEVGTLIRITLTPPAITNGDAVTSYRLSILDQADMLYKEGPCTGAALLSTLV